MGVHGQSIFGVSAAIIGNQFTSELPMTKAALAIRVVGYSPSPTSNVIVFLEGDISGAGTWVPLTAIASTPQSGLSQGHLGLQQVGQPGIGYVLWQSGGTDAVDIETGFPIFAIRANCVSLDSSLVLDAWVTGMEK
jgi:hypothetical protein